MKCRYCGFSQIKSADSCLFDSIEGQIVTATDKRLHLASEFLLSLPVQDIPGAALWRLTYMIKFHKAELWQPAAKTTRLFSNTADYLRALNKPANKCRLIK